MNLLSIVFCLQSNLYTLSICLFMINCNWEDGFIQTKRLFMNRFTSSFNLRCFISCYEYVFFPPFFVYKCLHMKIMWSPTKMFVMQKRCLLITAPLSMDNLLVNLLIVSAGLSWTWVRWSPVGHSDQLLHCCALFQVSFCFQKAVKEYSFYHCNVVNFVPVFSSVLLSQMYDLLASKIT